MELNKAQQNSEYTQQNNIRNYLPNNVQNADDITKFEIGLNSELV